jgi:hypothetical protein
VAFDNPPYTMDGTTVDGEVIRRAIGTLLAPAGGIVSPGDLPVTQQATPNMSVQVGAGQIWVPGTSTSTQGPYYARNSGPVTLAIAASNPSNPRVDTIITQVQDAAYAGATKQIVPAVVTGTPTAGVSVPPTTAAQAATDGAGAVPVSSYVLAYVLVPASATSIVTADIANVAALLTSAIKAPGYLHSGRAHASTTAAIGLTYALLALDTLDWGQFDTTNHRFVVPAAGLYQVNANASFLGVSGSGGASVELWRNGTGSPVDAGGVSVNSGGRNNVAVSDILNCAAGDTIGLAAWAAATLDISAVSTYLAVCQLA